LSGPCWRRRVLYFHRGQCCSTAQSNKQLKRPPGAGVTRSSRRFGVPVFVLMQGGRFFGGRMRVSRLVIVLSVWCSPFARGAPLQHEFLLLPSAQVVGTFD